MVKDQADHDDTCGETSGGYPDADVHPEKTDRQSVEESNA